MSDLQQIERNPMLLHLAAKAGDIEKLAELLDEGYPINTLADGINISPLAMAASIGQTAIVRWMIEHGADLQYKGPEGITPLRFAIQAGQVEMIRVLAELGADLNEYDPQIGSLLHVAIVHVSPEVVQTLLDLGVNRDRVNEDGAKPLQLVHAQGHQLAESLKSMGDSPLPQLELHLNRLHEIEKLLKEHAI